MFSLSLTGVESRLAALTLDTDDLSKLSVISDSSSSRSDLPSSFQPSDIHQLVTTLPALFNTLNARRAILPAANCHCSARALARYYAALVDGGMVPSPHPSSSKPPLGSHPHTPKFTSKKSPRKRKGGGKIKDLLAAATKAGSFKPVPNHDKGSSNGNSRRDVDSDSYTRLTNSSSFSNTSHTASSYSIEIDDHHCQNASKIFSNGRIHDAFLGAGEYENLVFPNGKFGLGFRRISSSEDGSIIGFGHSGMGGSTGFCDIKNRFAIAVTLNKMSFGAVTREIVQFVCSELNIPVPEEFSRSGERGPDMQFNLGRPLIN